MTDKDMVIKHNHLIEARGRMGKLEQRLFLTVVSMIRRDDTDFKTYHVSVDDFCKLTGTTAKNMYTVLMETARSLRSMDITIQNIADDGRKRFLTMGYLADAEYKDGDGHIEVSISPKLKPYLLELQGLYTTYELGNVLKLQSAHSVRLYELLKQYEGLKRRRIDLIDLREMLGFEDEYDRFFDFEKRVLKTSEKEINEFTDLTIAYTKIKKGRNIVAIEYTIKRKQRKDNIVTVGDADQCEAPERVLILRMATGIDPKIITDQQLLDLYAVAEIEAEKHDAYRPDGALDPQLYLKFSYQYMLSVESVEHPVAYLKKVMEADYAEATRQIKVGMKDGVLDYCNSNRAADKGVTRA